MTTASRKATVVSKLSKRAANDRPPPMGTTIDLVDMRAFVAVVTEGSFTAAAELLETDKARVSRLVSRMEDRLGARLLNRSTRSISVTEVGREYFEHASSILIAAEAAEAKVAQRNQDPKGRLKIAAGLEFGSTRVDKWIAAYLKDRPQVSVEAEYTNRLVDIIHEGVDIAIRIGDLQDSELSARKLGELTYELYAAPGYLEDRGAPSNVEDLQHHALIIHTPRGRPSWSLVNGDATETVLHSARCIVNNTMTAKNLAVAGLGIVQLPRYMARDHVEAGELIPVLAGWARPPVPVHAVFASTRYMDPKVREFVDVCITAFRKDASMISGDPA